MTALVPAGFMRERGRLRRLRGEREEALQLFRVGLLWRISTPSGISRQRFLRKRAAQRCIEMQDKHGLPVVEYKGKEANACKKNKS